MGNKYFASIETIDEANKAIRNASILAIFSGLVTIIYIFIGGTTSRLAGLFSYLNFYDVALLFTLVYLLYFHKSRVSAITLLIYYIISWIIQMTSYVKLTIPVLIWTALYAYIYYRGVQGTFAYAELNQRETLPWQLIIRNTFVFLFWIVASFYLSIFTSNFAFN
jgi:hypothetical protein